MLKNKETNKSIKIKYQSNQAKDRKRNNFK